MNLIFGHWFTGFFFGTSDSAGLVGDASAGFIMYLVTQWSGATNVFSALLWMMSNWTQFIANLGVYLLQLRNPVPTIATWTAIWYLVIPLVTHLLINYFAPWIGGAVLWKIFSPEPHDLPEVPMPGETQPEFKARRKGVRDAVRKERKDAARNVGFFKFVGRQTASMFRGTFYRPSFRRMLAQIWSWCAVPMAVIDTVALKAIWKEMTILWSSAPDAIRATLSPLDQELASLTVTARRVAENPQVQPPEAGVDPRRRPPRPMEALAVNGPDAVARVPRLILVSRRPWRLELAPIPEDEAVGAPQWLLNTMDEANEPPERRLVVNDYPAIFDHGDEIRARAAALSS